MDVVKLGQGERAPEDADCIRIETLPDGTYNLIASALLSCGDGEQAESVSMIRGKPYASYEEAEAAGLAWAADHCVEQLYVESGTE